MNPSSRALRLRAGIAAVLAGAAVAAGGCSSTTSGQAQPQATTSQTTSAEATASPATSAQASGSAAPGASGSAGTPAQATVTLTAPALPKGPKLTVTPPAGWVQSNDAGKTENNASVLTAFLIPDARANNFTPNTTVVITDEAGKAQTPEQALALDKGSVMTSLSGYQLTSERPVTVSGNPGQRLLGTWTGPTSTPLTVAITSVAVRNTDGLYLVDLVSQTTEGDDTGWQQAVRAFHDSLSIS